MLSVAVCWRPSANFGEQANSSPSGGSACGVSSENYPSWSNGMKAVSVVHVSREKHVKAANISIYLENEGYIERENAQLQLCLYMYKVIVGNILSMHDPIEGRAYV